MITFQSKICTFRNGFKSRNPIFGWLSIGIFGGLKMRAELRILGLLTLQHVVLMSLSNGSQWCMFVFLGWRERIRRIRYSHGQWSPALVFLCIGKWIWSHHVMRMLFGCSHFCCKGNNCTSLIHHTEATAKTVTNWHWLQWHKGSVVA